MIVYYMNLILTTILNSASRLLHRRKLEKSKCWEEKISFILCALAIATAVFVAGLRYGVGTDFFNYQDRFNHYLKYPNINIQRSNVGFGILIKFIQLFTDNPQWLFIATAIIIYTFIMLYIRENTKLYDIGFYLFICLYFYCSSLNIMRQWISIAIFPICIEICISKEINKIYYCNCYSSVISYYVVAHASCLFAFSSKIKQKKCNNTYIYTISTNNCFLHSRDSNS